MNLAQMRVAVRGKLSAGGGSNAQFSVDAFWADAEINFYLNEAHNRLAHAVRRANADYFSRTLASTDSAITVLDRSYNPNTMKMLTNIGEYTLPPDFVRLLGLFDARERDKVWFRGSSIAKQEFKRVYNQADIPGLTFGTLLYDLLNVRTLIVRPKPREDFDIILIYEHLLEPLNDYSTGTVSVTNASATATFAGADLLNRFLAGDELLVGTTTAAPLPDPNVPYPVIRSVDNATTVTLDAPYIGVTVSGAKYIRSRVSPIPTQHHYTIVSGGVIEGFKKGTNPSIESVALYRAEYERGLTDLIADVEVRQTQQAETSEAYLEDVVGEWS